VTTSTKIEVRAARNCTALPIDQHPSCLLDPNPLITAPTADMPSSAANIVMALALLAAAAAVCSAADSADVAQMILTGYYDSECLNPLPQTSHPNPQKCSLGECCSRSDGTTSIKLVSCGLHVNAVVYSDEKCESPIVKKTQQNGQIKLDLRKCSPTSGIFFAPGSFYKVECVVSV